ncbi:MAG: ABC transporter substrate-binding protein, partial [Bacteroidales bacterium]|nr:ABC transporter substrate-binding protein [Bacteroidales bacterium]
MSLRDKLLLWALLPFTLVSCNPMGDSDDGWEGAETFKVVAICPGGSGSDFARTAGWFDENSRNAQAVEDNPVRLEIEWIDEDTADLAKIARRIARNDSVAAVIGPIHSDNVDLVAAECAQTFKPMIVLASSEEIIRKYSVVQSAMVVGSRPFLWSLAETDISQCEVILSKAGLMGSRSVAVIAADNSYGSTFSQWMPFLAREFSMEMRQNLTYRDAASLASAVEKAVTDAPDCIVCALRAGAAEDLKTVQTLRTQFGATSRFIFTDTALESAALNLGSLVEGIEGIAMYADPASGFQIAYEVRFGRQPVLGESQFYDALLLCTMGLIYKNVHNSPDLNEAIVAITTDVEDPVLSNWNALGMLSYLAYIGEEHPGAIAGASGPLMFDHESYSSILHSTYANWMVYDRKFVTLGFASTDGGKRKEPAVAAWKWKVTAEQAIEDSDPGLVYAPWEDNYAIIIAGSSGWGNYRHQADALNIYQLLRKGGISDDRILLIMADDIASSPQNSQPGVVRVSDIGANLYEGAEIDYRAADLTLEQLGELIRGVPSGNGTNLLFFWSGHGSEGKG